MLHALSNFKSYLSLQAAILIARSSPPWFIVDRPFVFFIRHNPTGKWCTCMYFSLKVKYELCNRQKNSQLGKAWSYSMAVAWGWGCGG